MGLRDWLNLNQKVCRGCLREYNVRSVQLQSVPFMQSAP